MKITEKWLIIIVKDNGNHKIDNEACQNQGGQRSFLCKNTEFIKSKFHFDKNQINHPYKDKDFSAQYMQNNQKFHL